MSLPSFPVDDSTLDLLERAMTVQPGSVSTSMGETLRMLSELGGSDTTAVEEDLGDDVRLMRDPMYHEHDVIAALIAEIRRLRAGGGAA